MTTKLPPVDQAKLLVSDMDLRDAESLMAYTKFRIRQLKKAESSLLVGPIPAVTPKKETTRKE